MTLLRAAGIRVTFGSRTIFNDLTLTLDEGERLGLVGPNGCGKSTLLRVLAGELAADRGELQLRRGAAIVHLPQEPVFPEGATVASELSAARIGLKDALAEHAALSKRLEDAPAGVQQRLLQDLSALSDRIERLGGWDASHEARALLDRLGVPDWERPVAELSGGARKRVAIARALLARPALLLLDEPTNHLDAETVEWLEEALDGLDSALLLVTHDRYFLDDLVERIVELGPGGRLVSYPGNYRDYLEQKLVAEEQAARERHKRGRWISGELAWLRQGVEARRTKSKARIERARKLLAERGHVSPKVAALQLAAAPRLGDVVIEAEAVRKRFGDREVLRGVDLSVRRGERVGLVGRNGAGKTTLLRILVGELQPDAGTVTVGRNVKIAYYDQGRASLDPEQTVFEAAWDEETVEVAGRRIPLTDWLDRLLFPVPMQRMQVKALSGGERNRLLLARLFLQGANVLVLDEPTNDLDIVTLNVLEELLTGFGGAVLLVTHDRYFLDKVATSLVAFEPDGAVHRWPGGYTSYRTLKAQADAARPVEPVAPVRVAAPPPAASPRARAKLTYKEQRELEGMEATIGAAERRKAELEAALGDPAVYARDPARIPALTAELDSAAAELERLWARWQELQARAST